jgi:hypothetical protein
MNADCPTYCSWHVEVRPSSEDIKLVPHLHGASYRKSHRLNSLFFLNYTLISKF